MKNFLLTIVFVAIGLTSCKKKAEGEIKVEKEVKIEAPVKKEGNVNISTSVIEWKGSKAIGKSHNGTLKLATGTLAVEGDKITGGDFIIDMNSIVCLDIPAEEKQNADLVGHLKNADFFDVAKFTTAKFVIAEVKENGEKVDVTGNLTIKDKTKSITFPATFKATETGYSLVSDEFKINRVDFGVTFKSGTIDAALKDKAINDLLDFVIKVDAKK